MVNGGVLEVAGGGSGYRFPFCRLFDPQGLLSAFLDLVGCISPPVHATNCCRRTEGPSEVFGSSSSLGFLALAATGFGSASSVASRSAAPPTRLETRTKELNRCTSHWADETQRRSESKDCLAVEG